MLMHNALTPESLLLGGLLGYLIGSIPFAYIIMRRKSGIDIRKHGSGNVGALNAFEVSGEKSIGRTVLALDMLKGFLPVLIFELLGDSSSLIVLIPALVLGHCYPVWLGFRGGRGLATAAGALLLVSPGVVVLWGVVYLLGRRMQDNVHFASVLATCVAIILLLLIPVNLISSVTLPFSGHGQLGAQLVLSISLALLIILSRLIGPFWSFVRQRNSEE